MLIYFDTLTPTISLQKGGWGEKNLTEDEITRKKKD